MKNYTLDIEQLENKVLLSITRPYLNLESKFIEKIFPRPERIELRFFHEVFGVSYKELIHHQHQLTPSRGRS